MASSMPQGPTPEDWGGSLTSSDLIIASLEDLEGKDFERFKDKLSDFYYKDIRPIPCGPLENVNRVVTKNLLINFYGEAAALDVTVKVLRLISLMGPAEELQMRIEQHSAIKAKSLDKIIEADFRKRYMTLMKERYQIHRDGNACLGETVHLDKRYTKLLIIKKQRNIKEREHEIISLGQRHLEIMDERSSSQYSPITIDRLFDPDENGIVPKIVVLQGPAGVGKTMTSRKIILDWANGTFYQDKFNFIFYMSCRELNTLSGDISLAGLVRKLCQISCERDLLKSILGDPPKLLFLVDGFDELRWTSVSDTEVYEDPFQETSKEILLNSIFRQSCLQGASLIITTRPSSLEQLSKLFLSPRHVEILGFLGSDREQFFYGFFPTKEEAEFALSIVKDNDALFTMCAIPITCWIVCTVIKQQMSERQREIDCKTSTSIYLLYLKSLIKYHCRNSNQPLIKCVRKICTLANEGVWSQKILFGEDDLQRYELSIKDIESVFLNENIFQRDVETQTCYSFIHLTVQEFFAALYYVVGNKTKIISMASAKNAPIKKLLEEGKHKSHLQLTIQFLFGLFSEKQQKEMGKFLGYDQFSFRENSVMVDWLIKNHHRVSFKYLYETQDEDLIGRLMAHFPDIKVVNPGRTFDYRALSYCLKNSRSEHQIFFINCKIGPETRVLLSSALHKCSQVRFRHCFILGNEGDEKLPYTNSSLSGLFNSQCGIRGLQLYECSLKSYCCDDLCPVIANKSLASLSLSRNYLQDSGIKLLCKGLTDKDCVLQELRLQDCGLTSNCCADLCSFITTNRTLTMLDLSKNTLDDFGLKVLCEGLRHPGCTVEDLRFEACHFLPSYCEDLANIITASRSLKSIDLSSNDLQDSGVKHLCQGLQHPECALQELKLMYCGLTSSCCDDLRSVLITNRTLNKLLLKGNTLGNAGIKLLCDGLKHPGCTFQELRLESCGLTSYRCEDIRSVITTNQSLIKLDLTLNHLSDSGIESLCEALGHPDCILQELLVTKENLTRNLVSDLENEKPKKTFLPKWFWRSKPGNTQTVVSPKAPSQ